MIYNGGMKQLQMENKENIAVIGGGASGLFLAKFLCDAGCNVRVFERLDRVGKKLSATGNGQGNITNQTVTSAPYFSVAGNSALAEKIIRKYDDALVFNFFADLGVLLFFDERGRAYPAGRQASALTDVLRFYLAQKGVDIRLSTQITEVKKQGKTFALTAKTVDGVSNFTADKVVFCTGGKAQKNFGTDGSAYALSQQLGHSLTPTYPSLVQLKTDTRDIKTLKGIRVADVLVTATFERNGKPQSVSLRGDVIFTEYGVSGDAIFRISAYVTDVIEQGVTLTLDLLPDFAEEQIVCALESKKQSFIMQPQTEWLCGIVNNQVGRAVIKKANTQSLVEIAKTVKAFALPVTGSLGFDYAQVTKGGVPLGEVTDGLQSKRMNGVYFAGETLDVDGLCGGFNLQWAFASARAVADEIIQGKGQV